MRKITLLLLVIATASLTGAVAKGKKCEAQKAKYVVLIGSDGFSSDVVRAHPGAFPNIEALMKNGSYNACFLRKCGAAGDCQRPDFQGKWLRTV